MAEGLYSAFDWKIRVALPKIIWLRFLRTMSEMVILNIV